MVQTPDSGLTTGGISDIRLAGEARSPLSQSVRVCLVRAVRDCEIWSNQRKELDVDKIKRGKA